MVKKGDIMETAGSKVTGFFDSIKTYLQDLYLRFMLSPAKIIQLLACFGISFFCGFLLKRFGRTLILSLVFFILGILLLHYLDVVHIDFTKIQQFLGIKSQDTVESVMGSITTWLKDQFLFVVSAVIGFLIGYIVG